MGELTLKDLGRLMEKARKEATKTKGKTVSREMIGEFMGVNPQSIYEWEKGRQHPGFLNVLKFCEFIGITLDELLGVKKNGFCAC